MNSLDDLNTLLDDPEFQARFQRQIRAEAQAYNAAITYRNEQGLLVKGVVK